MNTEIIKKDDLLFYITKETMQSEAQEKIGRTLTDEELHVTRKGLESGLMTDIDTVFNTILFEEIQKN